MIDRGRARPKQDSVHPSLVDRSCDAGVVRHDDCQPMSCQTRHVQFNSHRLTVESRDRQCPAGRRRAALGGGLLVQKGRLTWPPYQLLSSLSTLAGCLASVGPLILIRSGEIEGSLGELMWLTGGLLVWLFDIEASCKGSGRPSTGPRRSTTERWA